MRNKNKSSFGILLLLGLIIVGVVYVYNSTMFEREKPVITLDTNGYWNLKKPLRLSIKDNNGLKSYRVVLKSSSENMDLQADKLMVPQKSIKLNVSLPRNAYGMRDKVIYIVVEATDTSKWNFMNGNTSVKKFKLIIDKKRPKVSIVTNSYKIQRGGTALVIFKAKDENLKDLYILSNHQKHFKAQPFYKEGYYIALLAWPVQDSSFKATVVAKDLAGNVVRSYVPLYLKNRQYRTSSIVLSDRFLKGKITDLAEEFPETQGVDGILKQFKIINEDVRAKNEKLIHEYTSKVPQEMISDFKLKKMYPLKNAQVVAHFGDHRKYYYNGKFISEAYHLGLDLASHAMAKIKTQNGGDVVFADYNGLYGNMPIIYHGLGLYTIYGHCSSLDVSAGDHLDGGMNVANTGKSGYAMGDHLHFGVLVQGVEVRPQEWMDKTWMKTNISDIIKSAKKSIDRE